MSPAKRDARRSDDPQPLGSVLDALRAERRLAAGMILGSLGRRWGAVVGERLAQESAPAALDQGVLLVKASSAAWAAQIKFLAAQIRGAANRVLDEAPRPGGETRGASGPVQQPPIVEVRVVVEPGHRTR